MTDQTNEISDKIKKIEDDLKAQEHRISHIIKNIIDFGFDNSDEQRRNSVWMSLISYLISRHMVTIAIGTISLFTAFLSIWLAWQANKLIEKQNTKIEQQTYLQEAERRSSLVFLFSEIMDKIDDELKDKANNKRDISSQLIARIVALSHALKPYSYLENGNLIDKPISPERGQLLIALLGSRLSPESYNHIFGQSDFSFSDLKNQRIDFTNIEFANLKGSDFRNSILMNVSFKYSDLSNCNFENVEVNGNFVPIEEMGLQEDKYSLFQQTTFHNSKFKNVRFRNIIFSGTNFALSKLSNVYLENCDIKLCSFVQSNIDSLNISSCKLKLRANLFHKAVINKIFYTGINGCDEVSWSNFLQFQKEMSDFTIEKNNFDIIKYKQSIAGLKSEIELIDTFYSIKPKSEVDKE